MNVAFGLSPTPTLRPPRAGSRCRLRSRSRALRMTSTEKPSLPSAPSPLELPPFVKSNPLTSALYNLFSDRMDLDPDAEATPDSAPDAMSFLSGVLASDVAWSTPLFDLTSARDLCNNIDMFLSFAIEPTLSIYSVRHTSEDAFTFEWTISFMYPLPWRPRVSVSGISQARTRSQGRIFEVVDRWYVPPVSVIVQSVPKLTDVLWLWPAPHAETDRGARRVLRRGRGYEIVETAARAEVRMQGFVEPNSRELAFVTPALPDFAFEGGLRRKELYSTVSPVSVRDLGDEGRFEWSIAAPGKHVGTSNVLMDAPDHEDMSVDVVERRVFAVKRFRGYCRRKEKAENLEALTQAAKEDGLLANEPDCRDVWVRVYDVKVGFNSSGKLAMAMYGHSRGVPRLNEIAIDVTEAWDRQNN